MRFDCRPSVNSAYRPTSSFVRTSHGQLEPVFPPRRPGICRFGRSLPKSGRIPDVFGSARRRRWRLCNATIVNGSAGARRCARPVRITLARALGGNIDGAWWPHSGSAAGELPEPIGVLHRPLGEIVDVKINWSPTDAVLRSGLDGSQMLCAVDAMSTGARPAPRPHRRTRPKQERGRPRRASPVGAPRSRYATRGRRVRR